MTGYSPSCGETKASAAPNPSIPGDIGGRGSVDLGAAAGGILQVVVVGTELRQVLEAWQPHFEQQQPGLQLELHFQGSQELVNNYKVFVQQGFRPVINLAQCPPDPGAKGFPVQRLPMPPAAVLEELQKQ